MAGGFNIVHSSEKDYVLGSWRHSADAAKVNTLLFRAPDSSYDLNTFPEEALFIFLSMEGFRCARAFQELIWLPRNLDPDDPDVEALDTVGCETLSH